MGEAYRGLTIRFKADGKSVLSVLQSMKRAGADVASELRLVNRALKFNGQDQRVAQRQLALLGEKAAAAGSEVQRLKREYVELGRATNVYGHDLGTTMREVSERTRDASTQAAVLKTRYNDSVAALGGVYTELNTLWNRSKQFTEIDPFKNWKKHPWERIVGYLGQMVSKGVISLNQMRNYTAQIKALKAEFEQAGAAYDKMRGIAQYQSLENKLSAMATEYRQAAKELAAAAKQMRTTGFDARLKEVRTEIEMMRGASRKLAEALELDPTGVRRLDMYIDSLQGSMQAASNESGVLREKIRMLASNESVDRLSRDSALLAVRMRESRREVDNLSDRLAAAKARADTLREDFEKIKVEVAEATKSGFAGVTAAREMGVRLNEARAAVEAADLEVRRLQHDFDAAANSARVANEAMQLKEARADLERTEAEVKSLHQKMESLREPIKVDEEAVRQLSERFKAELREMAEAAKMPRMTRLEGELKNTKAEVDRLSSAGKRLKQAMRANPGSFDLYDISLKNTRMTINAVEADIRVLREQVNLLGSSGAVRRLAADFERLPIEIAESASRIDRLETELGEAQGRVISLTERVKVLRENLERAGDGATDEMRADLRAAETELSSAVGRVERLNAELRETGERSKVAATALKLNEAKAGLASRVAELKRLNAELSQTQKLSRISPSSLTSIGMSMYATIYPMAMMAGTYAVQAARDVDSAYRNMRKTVQGTEKDFENLKKAALDYADTHFTSADQLLEIEAIGGQLGIAVENLEAFSTTVANLDIATDMEADDIALQLGKVSNILHIAAEDYDNFADALVRLGNSEPALESDIMNITTRFAGMAAITGVLPDQVLAIATATSATGMKSEAAGTSLQRTFGRIEAAVAGVSSEMMELEDIADENGAGFETAQGKLQGYADVAKMTAGEFAKLWESNPTEAFARFVEGLRDINANGGSVAKTLQDLGITGQRDTQLLSGLANTTDVLRDSLKMSADAYAGISDEWGDAGDAANEADKKMQGFSGQLQVMMNNGQHLAEMMGESLAPVLGVITEGVKGLVDWFKSLDEGSRLLVTSLIGIGVAAGPVMTFSGAVLGAWKRHQTALVEYNSVAQRTLRMQQSRIANMTGLASRYDAMRARLEQVREQESRLLAIQNRVPNAYRQRIAALDAEGKAIEKNLTRMSKMQGALTALSGIGKMAGATAAIVVIEQIIAAFMEAQKRAENFMKATMGLQKALDKLEMPANVSLGDDKSKSVGAMSRDVDAAIESQASLSDRIAESYGEVQRNAALAELYADRIKAVKASYDGSAQSASNLAAAVQGYNDVTGSSIAIIDTQTGQLNVSTDALDRNTAAWIANARAKAAEEAYNDLVKEGIKLEDEKEKAIDAQAEAYAELDKATKNGTHPAELGRLQGDYETATAKVKEATAACEENAKAQERAFGQMERYTYEAQMAAQTTDDFRKAVEAATQGTDSFDAVAERLGIGVDDLAAKLAASGIAAADMAALGSESFSRLYREAKGDTDLIALAIQEVNKRGFDPKYITIDPEQRTISYKGEVIDVENELNRLDGQSANPSVSVSGVWSALENISRVMAALNALSRARAIAPIVAPIVGNAKGGLFDTPIAKVPAHAAGGWIATKPTMTNIGLVGEAGSEWVQSWGTGGVVLPLSNQRYVRPIAHAIAAEMGGGGDTISITVNAATNADPDEIAGAIGRKLKMIQMARGR